MTPEGVAKLDAAMKKWIVQIERLDLDEDQKKLVIDAFQTLKRLIDLLQEENQELKHKRWFWWRK